jgi:hypothetical protein
MSGLARPLLPAERDALLAVLGHADFAGRDALVAQVAGTTVVGTCACGCATVDLEVDHSLPSVPWASGLIPNEAQVLDGAGEPLGGILVFLTDGYLSLLEVFSYAEPITSLPAVDRLRLR